MSLPDLNWLKANFPDLTDFKSLGQGGQKLVMTAHHKSDGEVVLKIIHPRTDVETVRREILAVQQIRSPRVPRIMAYGSATTHLGPCVWIREELIKGQTVRQMLVGGPLAPTSVLRLGLHMMEALERAEAALIVHRDVKPENIICDLRGTFRRVSSILRHPA